MRIALFSKGSATMNPIASIPPAEQLRDDELQAFREQQKRLIELVTALSQEVANMRAELAANTEMTMTVRDASTFVRVGTNVLKWLGVIAIAAGSVVVGWKMATGASPDVSIGPRQ